MGNLLDKTAFLRFIGQFSLCPGGDWATTVLWWFTRESHYLRDLLRGELSRCATARGIAEHLQHEPLEETLIALLGLSETRLCSEPAITPFFDGIAYTVQVAGGL